MSIQKLIDEMFKDERTNYDIKLFESGNARKIGCMEQQLKKKGDTINIKQLTEITYPQRVKNNTTVNIRREDLVPESTRIELETTMGKIEIQGEYKKKSVYISLSHPSGTRKKRIKLPNVTYDNASMLFVLRAVDFDVISGENIKIFNCQNGQIVTAKAWLEKETSLKTVLGEVVCLEVDFDIPEFPQAVKQQFFYSKEPPFLLLQNITGPQVIEIEEYN